MKKRFLSILLSIILCCCLFPAIALAAETETPTTYSVYVGGEQFASDKLTLAGNTGTATYDPTTGTITLNNYSYTGTGDYYNRAGIYSSGIETLNIVLVGENTISNTSYYEDALNNGQGYGIRTIGNLNIAGDGSLAITAKTTGIEVTESLKTGSDLHITVKTNCGIDAASVEMTGGETEIYADADGGNYGILPYGIYVYEDFILSGGALSVSAAYGYGIEAYSADISDSTLHITACYDALYAADTLSVENAVCRKRCLYTGIL